MNQRSRTPTQGDGAGGIGVTEETRKVQGNSFLEQEAALDEWLNKDSQPLNYEKAQDTRREGLEGGQFPRPKAAEYHG